MTMTSVERKAKRLTMITKDPITGQETCMICGAQFVYSKTLHDHIDAKHLQILAYACKYCDKRFTNRGNKYAHESQIHRYEKRRKEINQVPALKLFPAHRATSVLVEPEIDMSSITK